MLKTVILIGGPQKGTRFRPLSLDIPKPLFPVAGFPMIQHLIEAAAQVPNMREIFLIGSYQPNDAISRFITNMKQECNISIRYLQEFTALGTAGGIYHFRDQILGSNTEMFFIMNGDVCGDFQLEKMLDFHRGLGATDHFTMMGTEATRQQSLNYGCIVENPDTKEVLHYVEKPKTFVSTHINCGIYLFSPAIFEHIKVIFKQNQDAISYDIDNTGKEVIRLEQDILSCLAGSGKLFLYKTEKFWSQIKSSGAAVYANRHYLDIYKRTNPEKLAENGDGKPTIIDNVFIHSTATVHPTATLGPNVTVGKNVQVGAGVRIRESIILDHAVLEDHCCILHSIVGWKSRVGEWTRIEGTPNDPNPNKPFAKLEIPELFSDTGKLNPSLTVIGSNVQVPREIIVLNSIVLPHKELNHSYKNQIIL